MGTFELELPDGMAEDIEAYIDDSSQYTSKSELIRDAIRHHLQSKHSIARSGNIHINQQQIDRVDAETLKEVKSEQD